MGTTGLQANPLGWPKTSEPCYYNRVPNTVLYTTDGRRAKAILKERPEMLTSIVFCGRRVPRSSGIKLMNVAWGPHDESDIMC